MAADSPTQRRDAPRPLTRSVIVLAIGASLFAARLVHVSAQQDAPPPAAAAPAPAVPAVRIAPAASARAPFAETIPGTLVRIEMVPVGDLWMSATEVTWDAYDVFVFGLDRPANAPGTPSAPAPPADAPAAASGATPPDPVAPPPASAAAPAPAASPAPDAVVRPTKPHMVTDRGFGHAGYPALSMSCKGAQAFCTWLSGVTGRRYRLPTEAEWEAACRAGGAGAFGCGDDPACLDAVAWYRGNSDRKTHAVGGKAASALGLFDMHGNAAEWCLAPDGTGVLRGGSYLDPSKDLRCDARVLPVPAWNRSDPNLPKSVWWLADASFVGFRIVCEDAPPR